MNAGAGELAEAIADRPHWRMDGPAAVYCPPGAGAAVRVQTPAMPAKRERYRASIIRGDRAEYSLPCASAAEAVRWAERVQLT